MVFVQKRADQDYTRRVKDNISGVLENSWFIGDDGAHYANPASGGGGSAGDALRLTGREIPCCFLYRKYHTIATGGFSGGVESPERHITLYEFP
jgi:hypothetical protein